MLHCETLGNNCLAHHLHCEKTADGTDSNELLMSNYNPKVLSCSVIFRTVFLGGGSTA